VSIERTAAIEQRLNTALLHGRQSISARIKADCPFCGAVGTLTQDGVIATGLTIEYGTWEYKPERGEVLKNNYMRCSACGQEQWS